MDEPIRKLTPEEAAKTVARNKELEDKIHEAAEAGRIEFCPTVLVDAYEKEIELLLDALGHPEALVTDESRFADFVEYDDFDMGREKDQKELDAKLFGLGLAGYCTLGTRLVEAAALLRQRGLQ